MAGNRPIEKRLMKIEEGISNVMEKLCEMSPCEPEDDDVTTTEPGEEDIFEKVEEFEEEISPTKTHEHSFSRPSLTKTIAIGLIVTVVGGIIVLGVWELFFPEISK